MSSWASLPAEMRLTILEQLLQHGEAAPYASVSKEWRAIIETRNFHRLKLKQSCLDEFKLIKWQRGLVKHLSLNIELRRYTCRCCHLMESETWTRLNNKIIVEAVSKLFSVLSTWAPTTDGLTLELNAYSPSDSEHWFKNCYFGAPGEDDGQSIHQTQESATSIDDPKHRWVNGKQLTFEEQDILRRPYGWPWTELRFKEELPHVQAVTKFLVRRHCRRQWSPRALWHFWSKFPRLEEIVYEPWQLYIKVVQEGEGDKCYREMIEAHLPESVKKLSIFEDFNEDHLVLFDRHRYWDRYNIPDLIRIADPAVGAAFAARSLQLEQLSVSFMVDADHFFKACKPHWTWDRLRSLTLSSRMMTPTLVPILTIILRDAGEAALRMPELQTMTLWNGLRGEACAFKYSRKDASIAWRGTWKLKLEPCVLHAWEKVSLRYARIELWTDTQLLGHEIRSHGDAIHSLDLASVIDPVSLWQIRKENP